MCIPKAIAIDGPAASGKSTIGQILAGELGYLYFDTGIMYRAVTWAALQELGKVTDEAAVSELANRLQIDVRPPSVDDKRAADVIVDNKDITWEIRAREVNEHVSEVSAYPGVRQAMTIQQRRIGSKGNVIMVGRDIGTVVLPQADLKIYLDASLEERARRRYQESLERGEQITLEEVSASLLHRDEIDSSRALAPLRPAEDAVIIDSDNMTVVEVLEQIRALVHQNC